MNNETVIRVENLAVSFGPRTIFKDVSFEVKRGEVFVILGGSGCGKSTLLKALIGIVPIAAGRSEILGVDLAEADAEGQLELLKRIGVMWQSGALFGNMTLSENVELPLEEHTDLPRPAREALARAKLGLVGLGDAAGLLPAEISGGMAKRAQAAQVEAQQWVNSLGPDPWSWLQAEVVLGTGERSPCSFCCIALLLGRGGRGHRSGRT